MRITIKNDFHNTETTAYAKWRAGGLHLSPGQVKRIKNDLCGMDDCQCSGELGDNGQNIWQFEPCRIDNGIGVEVI